MINRELQLMLMQPIEASLIKARYYFLFQNITTASQAVAFIE